MKENILKLLQSTVLEDVILAITLAYELSSEEFKELFYTEVGGKYKKINLKHYGDLYYQFHRDNISYIFGCVGLGASQYTGFNAHRIDITPEQYKTN